MREEEEGKLGIDGGFMFEYNYRPVFGSTII